MKGIFSRLLGFLPYAQQEQQEHGQEKQQEQHDEKRMNEEYTKTEAAENADYQPPEPAATATTTAKPSSKDKKAKTVTINVPLEEPERRHTTDDIMRCIDQIGDGELTRAELEKITGALRRKLKGHTRRQTSMVVHKAPPSYTPSKVIGSRGASKYFLNEGSSNLSLFAAPGAENSIPGPQQATGFVPAITSKIDLFSTIKPRDDDSAGSIDVNEISAIEPVKCEKAPKTSLSGPIRRGRQRHCGGTVPWAKRDCAPRLQPQPEESTISSQTGLFGLQMGLHFGGDFAGKEEKEEGGEKKTQTFSEVLDGIFKKMNQGGKEVEEEEEEAAVVTDANAQKLFDFNPDHRAPSPMKGNPLVEGNGMFSSLEPILK